MKLHGAEIWVPVPCLRDYLASSRGRIMRLPHIAPMPNGGVRVYGGQPTKGAWAHSGQRYLHRDEPTGTTYKVARLICEAFHGPAPATQPVCIHINEDPRDNRPDNLRWGTQKENLNHPKFREYAARNCQRKMKGQLIQNTRAVSP